jgi:hypothetical protein
MKARSTILVSPSEICNFPCLYVTKLGKSRKKAGGPAAKRQSKETVRKHVNEGAHSDPEYAA